MLDLLQTVPTFPQLLETLWEFAIAWVAKYWWAVTILLILVYTRHYRTSVRSRRADPAIDAIQRTGASIVAVATASTLRLVGLGFAIVAFVLWLLQSVGTFWFGIGAGDPIIIANLAAIAAAFTAALGFEIITPGVTLGIFIATLGAVTLVVMADRRYD